MQILVQKIFQNLLRLDLPCEVYERAVEICVEEETDLPRYGPVLARSSATNEVKYLLEKYNCLHFEGNRFLKLLFNKILQTSALLFQPERLFNYGQ